MFVLMVLIIILCQVCMQERMRVALLLLSTPYFSAVCNAFEFSCTIIMYRQAG